jgi:hypothetical protein
MRANFLSLKGSFKDGEGLKIPPLGDDNPLESIENSLTRPGQPSIFLKKPLYLWGYSL